MAGDAEELRELVLWARSAGILLQHVQVGSVQVTLTDPKAVLVVGESASPESVAAAYGGPTLAEAMRAMGGDE